MQHQMHLANRASPLISTSLHNHLPFLLRRLTIITFIKLITITQATLPLRMAAGIPGLTIPSLHVS
jgi:hypothetical protein